MKKYKLIGLTGTTGAGKGEVRKILAEHGYSLIDADELAREIIQSEIVLESIKTFFGNDVVNGKLLDRKLLAERAFSDREHTDLLNRITHPHIAALFFKKLRELSDGDKDKILFDAPQLFESGLDIICDKIIAVLADKELRVERITQRDFITEEQAKNRISAQLPDDFFEKNSDLIIYNNSTVEALTDEVERVIDEL